MAGLIGLARNVRSGRERQGGAREDKERQGEGWDYRARERKMVQCEGRKGWVR